MGNKFSLVENSCDIYKLTVDFEKFSSVLHVGKEKLTVSEAISRLLAKLKGPMQPYR